MKGRDNMSKIKQLRKEIKEGEEILKEGERLGKLGFETAIPNAITRLLLADLRKQLAALEGNT